MADDETSLNFLDLSKVKIKNDHQLESAVLKVADLRLRSEKFREEDIANSLLTSRSNRRLKSDDFPFLDPIPLSMRDVNILDVCQVDIDWRMLTLIRPNNKLEEDIFTRYVELAKLSMKARDSYRPVVYRNNISSRMGAKNRSIEDSGDEMNQSDNTNEFCYDYFCRQTIAEEDESEENQSLDVNQPEIKETGAKRRQPIKKTNIEKKQPEMTKQKSNQLSVPKTEKTRSRSSTPETKGRGRKSRSVTPIPKKEQSNLDKNTKKTVNKKKAAKKKIKK